MKVNEVSKELDELARNFGNQVFDIVDDHATKLAIAFLRTNAEDVYKLTGTYDKKHNAVVMRGILLQSCATLTIGNIMYALKYLTEDEGTFDEMWSAIMEDATTIFNQSQQQEGEANAPQNETTH